MKCLRVSVSACARVCLLEATMATPPETDVKNFSHPIRAPNYIQLEIHIPQKDLQMREYPTKISSCGASISNSHCFCLFSASFFMLYVVNIGLACTTIQEDVFLFPHEVASILCTCTHRTNVRAFSTISLGYSLRNK